MNFKEYIKKPEYDFLRTNINLAEHICLLVVGGSYAYGMNNENSDVDIRGIATNSKFNILTRQDFEQIVDTNTDTTVYSFDKIINLFCSCNPNTIEMLGVKPEHYIKVTPIGQEILDNKELFLSKKAIHTFGGYANAQLRRLENKAARLVCQDALEKHILKSIENASIDFKTRFFNMPEDSIKLYIDKAVNLDFIDEIFMDINLNHYPLRDYVGYLTYMNDIIKSYNKIGKRNEHAIEHNKLAKHMAHLVRLYYMCFDILEKGEINTYREKEHDLLMSIRNGNYLDENRQPIKEFYDMVNELESKLDYLKVHTDLPDTVDMVKVNKLVANINEMVVNGII